MIETELLLSDQSTIDNIIDSLKKKNKGKKIDPELIDTLEQAKKSINQGIFLSHSNSQTINLKILSNYNFLTLKPIIIASEAEAKSTSLSVIAPTPL